MLDNSQGESLYVARNNFTNCAWANMAQSGNCLCNCSSVDSIEMEELTIMGNNGCYIFGMRLKPTSYTIDTVNVVDNTFTALVYGEQTSVTLQNAVFKGNNGSLFQSQYGATLTLVGCVFQGEVPSQSIDGLVISDSVTAENDPTTYILSAYSDCDGDDTGGEVVPGDSSSSVDSLETSSDIQDPDEKPETGSLDEDTGRDDTGGEVVPSDSSNSVDSLETSSDMQEADEEPQAPSMDEDTGDLSPEMECQMERWLVSLLCA